MKVNKLSLSLNKTHCLLFTRNSRSGLNLNVYNDEAPVRVANRTKFLGVILCDDLSWKHHIEKVSQKIAKGIGFI